jgi:hypothetical protein
MMIESKTLKQNILTKLVQDSNCYGFGGPEETLIITTVNYLIKKAAIDNDQLLAEKLSKYLLDMLKNQ